MQFSIKTRRILTFLSLSLLLTLAVVAGLSFSPWHAAWLGLLAALTYFRPAWGVALLFLVISVDQVALVPGGVFVNFSEFEFGAAFLAWTAAIWTKPARSRCCDWRPLQWGGLFVGRSCCRVWFIMSGIESFPTLCERQVLSWHVSLLLMRSVSGQCTRLLAGFWPLPLCFTAASDLRSFPRCTQEESLRSSPIRTSLRDT